MEALYRRNEAFAPPDDDVEVVRRVGAAWRELRRGAAMASLRSHLLGHGPDALDQGQVDTLDLLAQEGACRMSELAGRLRVDASTATRAADRLVRHGLAARRRDEDDARGVRVVLTAAGRARHAALVQRRRAAMRAILAGFDEGERRLLADLLERLVAGVDTFAHAHTETEPPPAETES